MGRLSGFKYREVARKLRSFGYIFDRPGPGSHEVWRHKVTGRKLTLPHRRRAGGHVTRYTSGGRYRG